MIKPPFLSYKRTDAPIASALDDAFCEMGIGPWRDIKSLGLGQRTDRAIKRAIRRDTGGFLWLATPESLQSDVVCDLEIPTALRRRKRSRDRYPFVPLFSGLDPYEEEISDRLGSTWRTRKHPLEIRQANGIVRLDSEDDAVFARRAAEAYLRESVLSRAMRRREIRVQFVTSRAPDSKADFVFDWSKLLPEGWPADQAALDRAIDAVRCLRSALQALGPRIKLLVAADLRLPLAAKVGWELSSAWLDRVSAAQSVSTRELIVAPETHKQFPAGLEESFSERAGSGPHVVGVSTRFDLSSEVLRYADSVDAKSVTTLHVPGSLDSGRIAALTEETRRVLIALGGEKHLLVRGPSTLAFWIGRNARGTGETIMPFWDQADGYSGHLVIGGSNPNVSGIAPVRSSG